MLRVSLATVLAILMTIAASAERRVALVMGADAYRTLRPLDNGVGDALAIKASLENLDFDLVLETDRDLRRMRRALEDFRQDAAGADVALVFFAGHGVEISGENRLLPVDADATSPAALKASTLPLEEVRETVAAVARIGLIVLDACRNDPFGGASGSGRGAAPLADAGSTKIRPGLGRMGRSQNILFAFSAAPGETAADGTGENSPFTTALTKYLGTDGLEIRSVLTLVQQEVYDLSRGRQLPYVESGLPEMFFAATPAGQLPERERLLLAMADITPDMRAEVERMASDADMPLAPLYGALIDADAAAMGREARAAKLREAAQAFVKVRDELKTMASSDPEVARLRGEAETELSLGAFDGARRKLAEAAAIDSRSRQALKANFAERTLSEAATRYLSGGAARADLKYNLAIADYEKAVALFGEAGDAATAPDHADRRLSALAGLGDLYTTVGDIAAAGRAYEMLRLHAERRAAGDPSDPSIRRDLAISLTKLGNARLAQGDLSASLDDYRSALAMLEELTDGATPNSDWVGDRALAHDKIGTALLAQGNLAAATESFKASLVLKQRLAAADPADPERQRDLTAAYDNIGDAARILGQWRGAEVAYAAGLQIRQALAARDPANTEWQRDLSISHDKIGDVLRDQGDAAAALRSYRDGRAIVERLASRDPQYSRLRRDLAVSNTKIGNILREEGDLEAALVSYRDSLAIMQKLAASDPHSSDWQRDLSISLEKVADTLRLRGDPAGALASFEASLVIMQRLAAADPSNADWQRDLSITLAEIGNLRLAGGDGEGARGALGQCLDIRERLTAADPDNALWQRDLVIAYADYAQVADDPRAILSRALAITLALDEAGHLPPKHQSMIGNLQERLAALKKRK